MLGDVFKAYDVRHVYPDPLNESVVWRIGHATSSLLRDEATDEGRLQPMMQSIVVGHDMRTSSPSLTDALCEGVTQQGGSVIDIGLVDTPCVYFAINYLDCAGGVMVTASHNPPQYNGLKISRRHAKPVGEATGLGEIRERAAIVSLEKHKPIDAPGFVEPRDLWDAYRQHVHAFLDQDALRRHPVRIVVDASNGMAGTAIPRLFGSGGDTVEGLEILEMHFESDGKTFVHEPNPLVASNLAWLQDRVRNENADLGVCFDGDADRCVVIDEKGSVIGCDHLTAWLATCFLRGNPGSAIVYDLRSSKALEESVREAGGRPVQSRVGHVFMKSALAKEDAVFGGELSGHFYFRENFNADSGVIALASVLTQYARDGRAMSEIIAPIARYRQSGEMNFEVEDKDGALDMLVDRYGDAGTVSELDGVSVDCFDSQGWWCNVRKSNTEPLLRLNLEARDQETLDRMVEEIAPLLGAPVAH
ncbi:MAG: phosphomannomutase/phosphoglucomutase [Planctomycetota bacterium]|jgi:phosphomannomutase